jgi:hypothetical protein
MAQGEEDRWEGSRAAPQPVVLEFQCELVVFKNTGLFCFLLI